MLDQRRIVIENVSPIIENGLYAVKRILNQEITIEADILVDGHDVLAAAILWKNKGAKKWNEVRMQPASNDRFAEKFILDKEGNASFKIEAWVDYALNWQHGIERKINDNQHVASELLEGIEYIDAIYKNTSKKEQKLLDDIKKSFSNDYGNAVKWALSSELKEIFTKYPTKFLANTTTEFPVYVDRKKALFSTWYEFFPRSSSTEKGKHGTFKDCEAILPRIAEMGFDTLYFPPVHPIGEVNRKGKNNATNATAGDVGSPWGIGSKHGGHKDIHPELGTTKDFISLVKKAKELGIEVAMDYALQAAPDHPYVKTNKEWFKWRPDGTAQYAENPPKKYQDILPIYFESDEWKNLWNELLSVTLYWIETCDIKVFRVDNPHTKPFYFWGWLIAEVKKKHPDVLFLAEAFTRPKIMNELAKQGFTQSYTYFTWRNTKAELVEYVNELTKTDLKDYFRPNFWPNTPDILPYHLQTNNESIYLLRYFLAATLSSNTGVYGPVYEFMIHEAMAGKEEYYNSEKYEVATWDWQEKNKLTHVISKINHIRKEQEALQQTNNIAFCDTNNDQILAYYKWNQDQNNHILCIASLDSHYAQKGLVKLPTEFGIHQPVKVTDLITGNSYHWHDEWNYVELHPTLPFHLFIIEK
jgi:starch synthase (maltosyl-transferring)